MDVQTFLLHALYFFMAATVTVPLFRYAGLGAVLGYVAAGAVIGPWGLALITAPGAILHFAEIGIVLLLFVIGLELRPARLWQLRQSIFLVGGAQVGFTAALLGALTWGAGLPPLAAALVGVGLSLSSTAFALQLLAERKQLTSAHGRVGFAVLLFQDLAVIPLLALIPLLGATGTAADHGPAHGADLPWVLAGVGALAVLALFGRYLLRPLFRIVAATGVQEVFTAAALLVVVALALLMEAIGLSMALGAFIGGVLLADSEYRHELEADIEPFKGLLLGLFFMGVGMSADFGLLVSRGPAVVGLALGLVALKLAVLFAVARLFGRNAETSLNLALVLSQGGEFAFVLFGLSAAAGLLAPAVRDLLVLVVTLSMVATPVLLALRERLRPGRPAAPEPEPERTLPRDNQVIIAGLGRFGQIVLRVLGLQGIGVTALEVNPEQVDFVRRFGTKIHYGDASRLEVLRAAGAEQASVLVLAIDDPAVSLRTAELVKRHFPHLAVLARARNRHHAFQLMELGIPYIVREVLHSSLHLSEHLLVRLGVERDRSRDLVRRFLERDEAMLKAQQPSHRDQRELIAFTREHVRLLEQTFEADRQADGSGS